MTTCEANHRDTEAQRKSFSVRLCVFLCVSVPLWLGRQAMISANSNWLAALAALSKQPLYSIEFPELNLALLSFRPQDVSVTFTGYGVGLYGINPYGD